MSSEEIRSTKIEIPGDEIERLTRKINDTRHPAEDIVNGANEDYGMPTAWALDLLRYWKEEFSWKKAQDEMNQFPHFNTEIEGLNIHFIHQKSTHANAIPILLIHGWPGSFHEFSE